MKKNRIITMSFREIKKSHKRFFSLCVLSILGVSFFAGMKMSGPTMLESLDKYYDDNKIYDLKIISTLGLVNEDIKEIQKLNNEYTVVGSHTKDAIFNDGKHEAVLRLHEINEGMNNIIITEGRMPEKYNEIVVEDGIDYKTDFKIGDKIKLEGASSEIQVLAVAENHIDHYVYLTSDTYEKLYDIPKANTVLIDVSGSPDRSTRQAVTQKLIACEGVTAAVYMKDGLSNFNDLLDSLDLIVGVIILFSGLLSFVILLNLANINITERKHELATIKVLGFFDHEVGSYVYRENIITTVIGIIAGLIIGTFFERFVIVTAEVDSVMFMRDLPFSCCIYAVVMMLIFIVAVNAAVFLKLRNIDMASSMKAVE